MSPPPCDGGTLVVATQPTYTTHKETTMTLYSAIDLHSNNGVLSIIDGDDRVQFERRLPNELPAVLGALEPYRERIGAIAVESTYNWYWLVDGLMDHGYDARLVNTAAVPQ